MVTDEQITLYAIGAMDVREAADFERQLALSPALRTRVAEERAAAVALLASVETVAPPPLLKQKVMARIGGATTPLATTPPKIPKTEPRASASASAGMGLGNVWRWILGGLAAGFAVLAVVFGIGLINTQNQVAQLQWQFTQVLGKSDAMQLELQRASERAAQLERDLAEARADLEQSRSAVATAQSDAVSAQAAVALAQTQADELAQQLSSVQRELAVLNQSGIRAASVPSRKPEFDSGAINVFYSPDGRSALISVNNLPQLMPDQTYQVWLIKGNNPLPSSIFNTRADGTGSLIVESDEPFSAFDNLGVTIEPAGGQPTPNPAGPIFLGPLG